jgi:hypothetical protein
MATVNSSFVLGNGSSSTAATDLVFGNVITSPSISGASFTSGTTYTVGSSGTYMIVVNTASTTNGSLAPSIYVNGTATIYGLGVTNANLPIPQSRGHVSAIINLTAGNTVEIKVSNTNSAASATASTDGTTIVTITKL